MIDRLIVSKVVAHIYLEINLVKRIAEIPTADIFVIFCQLLVIFSDISVKNSFVDITVK